ncbi:DUF2147 domain-containing protein [Adhaeribacter soli]|uniref:DUF2147 domain-containing protein n=1 Tax=Adhaeribacter soli TaxID=2607655 RepID=A0A5N1J9K8_9BACT|nr:DUF2147 domain-containing protein [Adhaeribacter soli]KAA9345678.1 DUF2147 domain-containing protein [Adhaeribacter soli]
MKKYLFALVLFLAFQGLAMAQQYSPLGVWTNEPKDARFEIFQCGDKLCGKIVWLKEPHRDGKPKTDINNPDKKLQSRPIHGLVFIQNFEYDSGNKWDDGTIYDPLSGKTYSCYMKMLSKDQMEVKGYIGVSLIGRSQKWTRVK